MPIYYNQETLLSTIPVDGTPNTPVRLMRVVVPCTAGDVLDITAEAYFTNDEGYTVGVGARLWWYDVDDGIPWPHAQPWTEIPTPVGDNVPVNRHHLPITMTRVYQVPANWPIGHRMAINLMVDAHSTAWQSGDVLKVEPYGAQMVVRNWLTNV